MARVGVVTVTYRSAATIGACLLSLRAASSDPIDVVVVDNASDDDTVGAAKRADPQAVVVSRPTNDGYGVGNNVGVGRLGPHTEFVVFANPDTVWPEGSIDALVGAIVGNVGLVSPLLVGADGATQAIVENDLTLRRTLLGMTRLTAPVRPRLPSLTGTLIDVDWFHTAAAVAPVDVVHAVGGFDDRFYLFGEDADFCRQVRARGLRVAIATDVRVQHIGGASFAASRTADETAALRTRALATYLDKYSGRLGRRIFGGVGTVVYGLGRHRGQAREAWRALTR